MSELRRPPGQLSDLVQGAVCYQRLCHRKEQRITFALEHRIDFGKPFQQRGCHFTVATGSAEKDLQPRLAHLETPCQRGGWQFLGIESDREPDQIVGTDRNSIQTSIPDKSSPRRKTTESLRHRRPYYFHLRRLSDCRQ